MVIDKLSRVIRSKDLDEKVLYNTALATLSFANLLMLSGPG